MRSAAKARPQREQSRSVGATSAYLRSNRNLSRGAARCWLTKRDKLDPDSEHDIETMRVITFLTAALFTTITVARAGSGANTANPYVPTCDEFRGRLETADRMLNLKQIKPIRISRELQEINGDDLWAMHDADGEEIMDVSCRGGKFVRLKIPLPKSNDLGSSHPQFDYIAAGIFGFTGWSTEKVVEAATDVWKTKQRMTPERKAKNAKSFENVSIPGLCAAISYSEFTLGDCAD
jgi:hypothetical protein